MALTATERQRRRREKLQALAKASPDPAADYVAGDFARFLSGDPDSDVIDREVDGPHGIVTPEHVSHDVDLALDGLGVKLDWRAVEKAEEAVEVLADAALAIASLVNAFKWGEVVAAQQRLASAPDTGPEAMQTAMQEYARLEAIKRALAKKVRRDFPVTNAKGA